jgi:hypothetical protein
MNLMMKLMRDLKTKSFLINSRSLALVSSPSRLKKDLPELNFTTNRSKIKSSPDTTDISLNKN